MMKVSPIKLILLFTPLLAACVNESAVMEPGSRSETCAERAKVARAMAELHQYGGDLQDYISNLARQGASHSDIAAYKRFATQLESYPRLAGDGGREMGVNQSLKELAQNCLE